MNDLIRREDVIELLTSRILSSKGVFGDLGGAVSGVRELIKVMPSAEPEMKWIPVTERLPKTNGCYLVWRPHFFCGKIGMPAICYFDGQNTWHDSYGVDFSRVLHKKDITAWMPLPEPYGGDR